MAVNVADMLVKHGKVNRARIGVSIQPLSPAMARTLGIDPKTKGILVGSILPGSPADKAGLKTGDVIVGFNHEPVVSSAAFRLNVSASEIGKPYTLKYLRNGKEHSTEVVLNSAEKVVFDQEKGSSSEPETKREAEKAPIKDYGLEVQPLTPELAKGLGLSESKGLLVSSVKEGSPAEAAGLEPGDVITQVVRDKQFQSVNNVKEFQDLAGKADELMVYVKSTKKPSGYIVLSKPK
jgi:serine protease Do